MAKCLSELLQGGIPVPSADYGVVRIGFEYR